jgi:tetratricopeptide (TPR) repeat protein
MPIIKNKQTRKLIIIMSSLVFMVVVISWFYYGRINNSVDPRIVEARKMYEKYNDYTQTGKPDQVFLLMDSIEEIYSRSVYYRNSFETGVLYNNRAAAYLTEVLYSEDSSLNTDSLVGLAENNCKKSIEIYESWLNNYQDLNEKEIERMLNQEYSPELNNYSEKLQQKYLANRLKELQEARIETPRRLSVSYTNLGIIYRYRQQYDSAAIYYEKALTLWDQNLTAENNLNILLGQPQRKRSLIQKIFPPEKH